MRRLVITNGTGGSGKDTFCKYAAEYLDSKGYNTVRYSFVDFARRMLADAGIDTSAKTDKDRQLLAGLNQILENYDDIPFKDCCQFINDMLFISGETADYDYIPEDIADVIFLDVRSPEIIDRFKTVYDNVITVLVDNGRTNTATAEDSGVFNYNYDSVISNTRDMNYLKMQAKNFVDKSILSGSECRKKEIKT